MRRWLALAAILAIVIFFLPWTDRNDRARQFAACEVDTVKTFPMVYHEPALWPVGYFESCMRAADYEYLYDGKECRRPGDRSSYCYVRPLSAWWGRHIVGLP
jgi:hypothetical protein